MIEAIKNKLIEGNLYKNSSLDSFLMSEKLGVSEQTIKSCIQEETGLTFSGFVNEFRISVLVDILDKEILFKRPGYYYAQSGFRSRTPFERFFKKHTGMTVSDSLELKKKGE